MTSFGASLRRERELRGVSLQDIAASTKIGVRMLKAIEDDRLDKLPQGVFVRGFVLEYARFLALDEQMILTELAFHLGQGPVEAPPPVEPESQPSNQLATRLVNGSLVALILGGVTVMILSPSFSSRSQVGPLPAVDALSPARTNIGAPGVQLTSGSEANVSGALAQTTASVLPQPLQLTLTATEDCWIGLDVGGDRVENRVLKKGESFSITARQNASLAVGNAGGLLVAIDSGPPVPLGQRGEVKRNIPLSPEAISAFSAGSGIASAKPIG